MGKTKKYRVWLLAAGAVILVVLFFVLIGFGKEKQGEQKKVGFILSGSATEEGWNGQHYQGMKEACGQAGLNLLVKENVPEFSGQCEVAIRELIEAGCSMLVLSSYGYAEEVHHIAEEFPEIVFYVNSSEYHAENMTSYFVRLYQARYLAGIVAGMMTQTNRIGYVAAMNNNEVNRGISAFTLGVQRVNPEAVVTVNFTDTWDDEAREKTAAQQLIQNVGVDVLTYHQNQTYVIDAAEEAGIFSIGYHELNQEFSDRCLTSVQCDWNKVYKEMVQRFLRGKANEEENFWIGMEAEAVELEEFSELVPIEVRNEVEDAIKEILHGKEIFSGVIYDTEGNLQCGEDELISDERLLEQFGWFVKGVDFYEE